MVFDDIKEYRVSDFDKKFLAFIHNAIPHDTGNFIDYSVNGNIIYSIEKVSNKLLLNIVLLKKTKLPINDSSIELISQLFKKYNIVDFDDFYTNKYGI